MQREKPRIGGVERFLVDLDDRLTRAYAGGQRDPHERVVVRRAPAFEREVLARAAVARQIGDDGLLRGDAVAPRHRVAEDERARRPGGEVPHLALQVRR